MESDHHDAVLLIDGRIFFLKLRLDRFHLGLRSRRRHAVSQPAEHDHLMYFAIELRAIESERYPHVKLQAGSKKAEFPRKHSDDGVRLVVERNTSSQNARVPAVAPLPQSVTEHNHSLVAWPFLIRQEITPQDRRHSKQAEKIRAHLRAPALLRLATPRPGEKQFTPGGSILERAVAVAPVEKFRLRCGSATHVPVFVGFPNPLDPL